MNSAKVSLKLNNIYCFDEGDGIGSAEPYLWTVFFKIDGDTVVVTPQLVLKGTATVQSTPGNHGDLPNHDVDAGENVPVPAFLGEFHTTLKPIPLQQPIAGAKSVGGAVGCVIVLMEEDNTPGSAIASGHTALNKAVQTSLNALIPTLNFAHQAPTDAEITQMQSKIGAAVANAVKNGVSVWDWLGGLGNMDDKIGSVVFEFSQQQLLDAGANGIVLQKRWKNEGDWQITGHITATAIPELTHLPPGVLHAGDLQSAKP